MRGACWLMVALLVAIGAAPIEARTVGVATIDGAIGPATTLYVERAIEEAAAARHAALILTIDTPGGLVTATREIVSAILAAPLPVIGYVAPEGARAASAGAYILMATHVAAMAPATNVGAATPITIGAPTPLPASDEDDTEAPPRDAGTAKAINDAVASMRALAEKRGRNADWAERAVREAISSSASEALDQGVIEHVAANRRALLQAIDGTVVTLGDGRRSTLETADAETVALMPNWQERLLAVLANPNVAFVLMLVGIYGIIFEFANPGIVFSGVIGAIALLLGLFSLNLLPIDYAGVGLILLGVALMTAEAFAPSFGILGIGGAVAFALGAVMLIDTDVPGFTLSPWVIGAATLTTVGLMSGVLAMAVRAQRRATVTGREGMIGQLGRVVSWGDGHGTVHVAGENWQSRGPARLGVDDEVVVTTIEGLVLSVRPKEEP